MSNEIPNTDELSFEDFSHENGITYWWATEFMKFLGYENMSSFAAPIKRAMQACLASNIDVQDNIEKQDRIVDGVTITDYKLTRFGCYLIAMNANPKHKAVAAAQVYFAKQAENIQLLLDGSNDVDRLLTREDIKEGNKALVSTAKSKRVIDFKMFHHAGYMGLYNQSRDSVKRKKGIDINEDLIDYMGRTELAANLFRITLTEENLKNSKLSGDKHAQDIHFKVGRQVRNMVEQNTGMSPEDLKADRKLGEAKRQLKLAQKKFNKIDGKKKKS
ncbi:MAG: damage-inducible protein [Bacteroidetes bacterium]|nr:damage-inducible protein [Bacteroidota bacterium]